MLHVMPCSNSYKFTSGQTHTTLSAILQITSALCTDILTLSPSVLVQEQEAVGSCRLLSFCHLIHMYSTYVRTYEYGHATIINLCNGQIYLHIIM